MKTLCGLCLTLIVVGGVIALNSLAGDDHRLVGVVMAAGGFLGLVLIMTRSPHA